MLGYLVVLYRREIIARGGSGGHGCVSFRREKYVPFGGPDGGDGGDGGSVTIVASPDVGDLSLMRQGKEFRAGNGDHGSGWRKRGKKGEDLAIPMPVGTMVFADGDSGMETLLSDLSTPGQEIMVARGGRGGLGNVRFATAVNQAPEVATQGKAGEERYIVLELKPVTDICIVGHPNSGKSTLLSSISKAKPEIADYPFTTRDPVLGVMPGDRRDFVVAEIPGLVAGAHLGKGLGNGFLRHAERTKLLILLLDGSSPMVMEDLSQLDREIALYKPDLTWKPRIVVVNKVDLPQAQAGVSEVRQKLDELEVPVFYISAVSGQAVLELVRRAMEMVEQGGQGEETTSGPQIAVFRPKPRR